MLEPVVQASESRSPKLILDANLIYGVREAEETNPIYGIAPDTDRRAAALSAFFPVKKYESSALSVFVAGRHSARTRTLSSMTCPSAWSWRA
jgi:hypothetical protein